MSSKSGFYPLTVARGLVAYLSYFISKVVFVVLVFPVFLVLLPFRGVAERFLQSVTHNYLAFFSRYWLPFAGAYSISEISGLERTLAARPTVIVANHRSLMDALLLLGLLPRAGAVIKSRDTRKIMNGLLARYFDLVSIDRTSGESVAAALAKCRRLLEDGKFLIIFPEGTRARSGRLQRFNRLGFEVALAAGTSVTPVILHTTQPLMAKIPGSIFPRVRAVYSIRFLAPELPPEAEDADAISDRVHRRMAEELAQMDAGTPWEIRPSQTASADFTSKLS